MSWIWNFYLNFSIKFRLVLLCVCYSLCIVATDIAAQSESFLIKYGSMAVFILLGGVFATINIWSIITPIQRAISYLQCMAKGDLSQDIVINRTNEISRMLAAMKELQKAMHDMIAGMQSTAANLSGASGQLRDTSSQIAAGTENASQQSDSVTSAVDQMACVSTEISRNCQEMALKAAGTESATESGERTVAAMTAMMQQIEQMVVGTMEAVKALGVNSERIGNIVVAIEDIADQTNLLALNAAIEAARAGDQGRGFAVVADEVRNLAERTTTSTHEIHSIIRTLQDNVKNVIGLMEKSSSSVQDGSKDVQQSRQAIHTIREQIVPLISHVSQVAIAAQQQSVTSATITESMRHISQTIHDAASGAHRTEVAATELARSAMELQQMVSRFKIA